MGFQEREGSIFSIRQHFAWPLDGSICPWFHVVLLRVCYSGFSPENIVSVVLKIPHQGLGPVTSPSPSEWILALSRVVFRHPIKSCY